MYTFIEPRVRGGIFQRAGFRAGVRQARSLIDDLLEVYEINKPDGRTPPFRDIGRCLRTVEEVPDSPSAFETGRALGFNDSILLNAAALEQLGISLT
jgi:hypothetical protein